MCARAAALALLVLIGSCVGGNEPAAPDGYAELGLALQPALIPSAADADALPIHRIRTVVARQPDGAVIREERFDVSPTAGSWTLEIRVPVGEDAVDVVVYLELLNVAGDGTESVQFSGRTGTLSLSVGGRVEEANADIVRGPLSNLGVTGVTIVSAPTTLSVGQSAGLAASVASSGSTVPQVFWTSLDPTVVEVVDSTAKGLAAGTAQIVASAGAFADTTDVVVGAPTGSGANRWIANGSGAWSNDANWSLGRAPLPGDTVHLTENGDYTVTLDGSATVAQLVVGGGTDVITLFVDHGALTVTGTAAGQPEVEILALGSIHLDESTLNADVIESAGSFISDGDFTTVQADSIRSSGRWSVLRGAQFIGSPGVWFELDGLLQLGTEAMLQLGAGSELLYSPGGNAAIEGGGILSLASGSTLTLFESLDLEGTSLLLQESTVEEDDASDLTIGEASLLQLVSAGSPVEIYVDLILAGGLATTGTDIRLADVVITSTGYASLTGAASNDVVAFRSLANDGQLVIGGTVLTVTVAEALFSPGSITVVPGGEGFTIDGELLNDGLMIVGSETRLRRTDGAGEHVTATHINNGTIRLIGTGELIVQLGGTAPSITNLGTIELADAGTVLAVENHAAPTEGQIINTSDGLLTGIGTVDVRTGIPGGVNDGALAPEEDGPGILTWLGSVPMGETGTIVLEVFGPTPGTEHDQLNLSGDLLANGYLFVTAPGIVASPGDRFALITYRSRSGEFIDVSLPPALDVGWQLEYAEDAVPGDTLYLVATEAGPPAPVARWTNPLGGSWSDGANWSGGVVPATTDSVAIDLDGTYTVTLDVNATVQNLTVGAGSGTQTLAGTGRTLTLDGASAVYSNGQLTLTNSTVAGTGTLTNFGSMSLSGGAVSAPLTNSDGVIGTGGTTSFTGTFRNLEGASLVVGAAAGNTVLNVASGFTNEGTIDLTNTTLSYNATVVVTAGALINEGAIRSLPGEGNGGSRTLTAALDNRGTLTLDHPLTIDRASAAHVNSATILVGTDNLTVVQTADGSFTNNGVISIASGRTFTLNGGTVDLDEGLVDGVGTLSIAGTATLAFTTATVTAPMTIASAVTIPANVTVPVGETLTLLNGSVIDEPIVNQGTIGVVNTVAFNGPLSMPPGSILRIGALAGNTVLTVANEFTNEGTIELTNTSLAYNATLAVTNGTLVNQGAILSVPGEGNGGSRTLAVELDNQGTLTLDHPLTLDRADAAHVNNSTIDIATDNLSVVQTAGGSFTNNGAITIASGRTFTLTGGTVDLDQGSVSGVGALSIAGSAVYAFLTSTVTTPMTIASAVTIPANVTVPAGQTLTLLNGSVIDEPIVNQGTIGVVNTVAFNGPLSMPTGSLLRLGALAGNTNLTVANGFTNEGTIELTNTSLAYNATLAVTNGTLMNQGAILSVPGEGNGGSRTLAAELVNQGTLTLDHPLTLDRADAVHVNGATIDVATDNFTVVQTAGGSFTNNGAITVASGRTFTLTGGTVDLDQGSVSGVGTLSIGGTAVYAFLTSTVTTPMTIASAVTIPANVTVPAGQTLTLLNGTVIDEPITNLGTIDLVNDVTFNGPLSMPAGSILRIGALAGNTNLTVANGFINEGTIELTNTSLAYNATLAVTNGTLINDGAISILPGQGNGGSRTLAAELDHRGTLTLDHPLTISRADAAHFNNGTIAVATDNLSVTQTAGGSFTNNGTITVASGRTVTLTGGAIELGEGTISGAGTLSIAGTAVLAFTTSSVTTPMVIAQDVTIPNDVWVPAEQTLTLLNSSVIDEPILNEGTILIQGNVTFLGAFTMAPGSLLRVGALAGSAQLFFQDGFTNQGTIELTNTSLAYDARLGLSSGTLVNEGSILILPGEGNGGARYLSAELINDGTLQLDHPLTIDAAFANHVNYANIDVSTDNLTILQSAEGSFENLGTIDVASGRTLSVTGGALLLEEGLVTGAGTLAVGTGTDLAFNTFGVTTPLQINAGATLANDLFIPEGQTLTLLGNSVIDEPIDNQGTLLTTGNVAFNGALTNTGQIRVGALAGNSVLTVASDFTNQGLIELTNTSLAYNSGLTVTSGTFTNEGTFRLINNAGGSRTLSAPLANYGDVEVDANTTFASTLLQTNGSLLTVLAGRTLNVTGQMLLLEGSTTTAIGTLNPNGGCSTPQGGANITGFTCPTP